MTQSSTPIEQFRHAYQSLAAGNAPNGIVPADCGEWGELLQSFNDAHASGGTQAVVKLANTLIKTDKRLRSVFAGDAPVTPATPVTMPALPSEAEAVYQHIAPCGAWLDAYTAYAMNAAPMTPRAFHEAAGLFAASTAVARRLYCPSGTRAIYPNLYFLFVAPSTIFHKSTGMHIMQQVISDAGLTHLLMPQKASPQALVADLDYAKLPTARQMLDLDPFLARRAFAAKRGWIRDEASALFASLKQEFNAGLLELILDLYECPDYYDELTISRGESRIERAYLSFFGVSTPVEMASHFSNLSYWSNGLWARCLVLTPDEGDQPFSFFPRTVQNSQAVISGLNRLYNLFPAPTAELVEIEVRDKKREHVVKVSNEPQPVPAQLADGVWEAWEAYTRAVSHTLLHAKAVDEELYACYGRLGTLAMKIALLLAAMDTERGPVRVELRHYAAAQQRVEAWRAGLHRLWSSQSATNETRLMERVLKKVENAAGSQITTRDLCIALRQPAKEIGEALSLLLKSGRIDSLTMKAANGRSVEVWTCK